MLTIKAEITTLLDMIAWWKRAANNMDNLYRQRRVFEKAIKPIEEDIRRSNAFLQQLTHRSQLLTEDREDGVSNTALPYRNRYSDPFWYEVLVSPNMVENK